MTLPRGRHGLPREVITHSQRERLLAAVVRVTADKGYEATTIADILGEAGVGRETFYELFADKRDCVMAAHTILVDDLEAKVRAAYSVPGPWADRVRNALAVTLEWFSNFPAAARFTLIELAAVGPESRARFQADYSRFIRLLDDGLEDGGARPDFPQATSLAVGATIARLRGGRPRSHGRVAEAVARTHLRAARALSRRKGRQGRAAPRRCRYRPASAE